MTKTAKPSYVRWLKQTGGRRVDASKPTAAQRSWQSKKFKHDRAMRAKCRLLYQAGVPADALVREFGGVPSTMTRVIDNDYVQKDDEDEDLDIALLDPTFQARLDHLRANGFDNPNRHQRAVHVKRVKPKRKMKEEPGAAGGMDDPIIIGSESPPPSRTRTSEHAMAGHVKVAGPVPPPLGPIPIPAAVQPAPAPPVHAPTASVHPDAPNPDDFLLAFLTEISLEHLYIPLQSAGIDAAGLRRMARYDDKRLDAFMDRLATRVPGGLTPFMQLTLSDEIRLLAE